MKGTDGHAHEIRDRASRREALFCALVTVACLLPFMGKAFHIDDPMYLWAAEQIQENPLDFYGFDVNWNGVIRPMAEVNQNPPLVSFYLAGATALVGRSEIAVHLAMLLLAIALALGTYRLAALLSERPLEATLLAMLSPLILISSTTVMSDVLMLALWCWGLALWIVGLERESHPRLLAAALLLGLCPLAKYFGMAALPLAVLYAVLTRRAGAWLGYLLIPLFIVGAYHALTYQTYGILPLAEVAGFAADFRIDKGVSLVDSGISALFFLGGGLIGTVFYIPSTHARRVIASAAGIALLGTAALSGLDVGDPLSAHGEEGIRWGFLIHAGLFGFLGLNLLALVSLARREWRDPVTVLLYCWLLGVFLFAGFLNWTPSGRAMLPAAVPVSLLIVRRLGAPSRAGLPALRLLGAGALALCVTAGDFAYAGAQREAAEKFALQLRDQRAKVWFQGSWGFQWYMEQAGFEKIDHHAEKLQRGDMILIPHHNPRWMDFSPDLVTRIGAVRVPIPAWAATKSELHGAGFYARGPLPFVFGPSEPQWISVDQVVTDFRLGPPGS